MKQPKVFVAGKYNGRDVFFVLENMRRGMRIATELLFAGFIPFVPWFDHHFAFMAPRGMKMTSTLYYNYSMAWLEVCDCLIVISGSTDHKGVINEIKRAEELGLPVFYKVVDLINYYNADAGIEKYKLPDYQDPLFDMQDERWEVVKKSHSYEPTDEGGLWRCTTHDELFYPDQNPCPMCWREYLALSD